MGREAARPPAVKCVMSDSTMGQGRLSTLPCVFPRYCLPKGLSKFLDHSFQDEDFGPRGVELHLQLVDPRLRLFLVKARPPGAHCFNPSETSSSIS